MNSLLLLMKIPLFEVGCIDVYVIGILPVQIVVIDHLLLLLLGCS